MSISATTRRFCTRGTTRSRPASCPARSNACVRRCCAARCAIAAAPALTGVAITVLDASRARTDAEPRRRRFDLAVNGGGRAHDQLPEGRLPAGAAAGQVPWQDFANVAGRRADPARRASRRSTSTLAAMQVARGNAVTDADGSADRDAAGSAGHDGDAGPAEWQRASRSRRSTCARPSTRSAPTAPRRCRPSLPPTSGYTYAVELSADEAMAAGATRCDSISRCINYVENFLGFPVGTAVPTGYYDRVQGGVDAVGQRARDQDHGETAGLGRRGQRRHRVVAAAGALITAERQRLASLYPVGPGALARADPPLHALGSTTGRTARRTMPIGAAK